jgi:hypothetical protein
MNVLFWFRVNVKKSWKYGHMEIELQMNDLRIRLISLLKFDCCRSVRSKSRWIITCFHDSRMTFQKDQSIWTLIGQCELLREMKIRRVNVMIKRQPQRQETELLVVLIMIGSESEKMNLYLKMFWQKIVSDVRNIVWNESEISNNMNEIRNFEIGS